MTITPMISNAEMVKAILDGRKSQTRKEFSVCTNFNRS